MITLTGLSFLLPTWVAIILHLVIGGTGFIWGLYLFIIDARILRSRFREYHLRRVFLALVLEGLVMLIGIHVWLSGTILIWPWK
jgi:hypothetical protein